MHWDEYFMHMLAAVRLKSKDPHTKTACILVGSDHEILSTGYNSFPRGINDNVSERLERPEKYMWIEHAERNAIYNAVRHGTALKGATCYVDWMPCMDCGRALVQSGVVRVVYDQLTQDAAASAGRWSEHHRRVCELLLEAGVRLESFSV